LPADEAADQWKMFALDNTASESKCESDKVCPAIDKVWWNKEMRWVSWNIAVWAQWQKTCSAFPHGNADGERSLSANKNTVTAKKK